MSISNLQYKLKSIVADQITKRYPVLSFDRLQHFMTLTQSKDETTIKAALKEFYEINPPKNVRQMRNQRTKRAIKRLKAEKQEKLKAEAEAADAGKYYYTGDVVLWRFYDPEKDDKTNWHAVGNQKYERKGRVYVRCGKLHLSVKGNYPDLVENFSKKSIFEVEVGTEEWNRVIHYINEEVGVPVRINYLVGISCTEIKQREIKSRQPLEEIKSRDTKKISLNNRYITTEIDTTKETFDEAIATDDKPNECWINALVKQYKDTIFNPDDKVKRKHITREKLLKLIGKTEENVCDGLSIEDLQPFFKSFKINVRIYDEINRLIYTHEGDMKHQASFCAIYKDNHIYLMNNDIKSLLTKEEQLQLPEASTNFKIMRCEEVEYKTFATIHDIVKIYRDTPKECKKINLIHNNNELEKIFFDLINAGVEPSFSYTTTLKSIYLNVKDTKITINNHQMKYIESDDGNLTVSKCEKYFTNYTKVSHDFYGKVFKESHKSSYNETDKLLELSLAPNGSLDEFDDSQKISIDLCRAFTHAFTKIKKAPVFNAFDSWRLYNNEPIEEYNLYYVENTKDCLFFGTKYGLVYGLFLEGLKGWCNVIAVKTPSNLYDVNYSKIIEDLYATDINEDDKKIIANVNIGLMGKWQNKASLSVMHQTNEEACHFMKTYGGKIRVMTKDINELGSQELFINTVSQKKALDNGFKFIKELLLEYHNYRMHCAYEKLKENGVKVYNVHTDAFVIDKDDLKLVRELLKFDDNKRIGCWRLDSKPASIMKKPFEVVQNQKLEITNPEGATEIKVDDERDMNNFNKHETLMIRSELPGCGKSYICEHLHPDKSKILFVCTTRHLCEKYEEEKFTATTVNSILGDYEFLGPRKKNDKRTRKIFDLTPFEIVVFDEIYMYSIKTITKIVRLMEKNKKRYFATGDAKQLPAIEDLNNCENNDEYKSTIFDRVFKNKVNLKIMKRIDGREWQQKIFESIKKDLFEIGLSNKEVVEKYFKDQIIDDVKDEQNICLKNEKCAIVSQALLLKKKRKIQKGDFAICKKYFTLSKQSFGTNKEYEVAEVKDDSIVLYLTDVEKETFEVFTPTFNKHFILSYARTCHAYQGCTIKENYTIFQYDHYFATAKWFWTALTRTDDFTKISFFNGSSDALDEANEIVKLRDYFQKKIDGYSEQDKNAKRPKIDFKQYINVDVLMKYVNMPCLNCQEVLTYYFNGPNIASNITADRIDNSIGHSINNCRACCDKCNKAHALESHEWTQ